MTSAIFNSSHLISYCHLKIIPITSFWRIVFSEKYIKKAQLPRSYRFHTPRERDSLHQVQLYFSTCFLNYSCFIRSTSTLQANTVPLLPVGKHSEAFRLFSFFILVSLLSTLLICDYSKSFWCLGILLVSQSLKIHSFPPAKLLRCPSLNFNAHY